MKVMKRLLFLLLLLFLFFLPQQAYADNSWDIENFNSQIAVQQSGIVHVTETISVDFRTTPKHGIYRDIPYLYTSNGKQTYTDVEIKSVLQNNEPIQYTSSQTNGYKEIKIGDPAQIVVGRNVYKITYSVSGILESLPTYDELYWNVTGNNWPVEIQKVESTVILPKNGILQISCYEGLSGSQQPCQSTVVSPQSATFATTKFLENEEGLTIVVAYKKGLMPLLTAQPPKPYWEKLFLWPSVLSFILVVLIGICSIGLVWYRYGRDYWFAGILFGTKDQKGKIKPVGSHETISVEFVPPNTLRPAEIGVLMAERADTTAIVATIIDLATRGYLTITEIPKKWKFGKIDYLLTKSSLKKKIPLLRYEQILVDKLFYKRRQVKLSTLKTTFYTDLKEVKQALYEDVVEKKFFSSSPERIRSNYIWASIILFIGGAWWLWYGFSHTSILFGDAGGGFLVDSVLVLFVSRYMPRRTAYGRDLYRRSKGYYLFIDRAEKYRQRYFEKKNMFNTILPYAIVFGLTKKFAKQMQKLGVKPEQTGWYVGNQSLSTGVFIGNIDTFSHSMSSSMAATPSSSGVSSGSSGGGFGGGGGGAW